MLLQLNGVSKSFGSQNVLWDVSFQINSGEKLGLIGANGAGKTTLLKIIGHGIKPDAGIVSRKSGLHAGTLDQIPDFHEGTSVIEEALRAFDHLRAAEGELRDLEHVIAENARPDLLERYSQRQHEFELNGGYAYRPRTEGALLGIGFAKATLNKPSRDLSGGEKNRLVLATLLLSNSELLLLDEPTNHLDIRAIEWLERFLKDTEKTVIVVSHDRFFLDRVVSRIIEVENGRTSDYRGNYTAYLKERAERQARREREWRFQAEWIEKQEEYIRRNIAGQKTKQAQSRRKLLARVKAIERPKTPSLRAKFRFMPIERTGRYVLCVRNLSAGYSEELVSGIGFEVQRGERWAILGPNGSGKTTLLRTLVGRLSPIAGELEWNEGIEVGYYDQQLQDLNIQSTVLEEIRRLDSSATDGELRSYLAQFLFSNEDVFKQVGQLSGGEKSRLMLAKIIYEGPQLLALDEPTNHLDIASREALESALMEYSGTIVFVTHDRYLVEKIATHLLYVENGRAHIFDRLAAFEQWLEESRTVSHTIKDVHAPKGQKNEVRKTSLSKNKRDQLEREAAELEARIASTEQELAGLERSFQNPGVGLDWEETHRKYADLKEILDKLYRDLGSRWESMG